MFMWQKPAPIRTPPTLSDKTKLSKNFKKKAIKSDENDEIFK